MARILLADDNEELLQLLTIYLTSQRHEVVCATDGALAVKLFHEGAFDILVTDLMMPNKEGLETIMEIRAESPNMGIIAMSGGGLGDPALYLKLADSFGAHSTLSKPFSLQELTAAIEMVLSKKPQ